MSLFLRYEDMWDRALGGTTDEKQIPHWFANFAYVLIGFVFKVLFRYRVDGRENLRAFKDRCGAVVVSNHTSFLDVVLMYVAARQSQFVRLMGRDSLFGNAHGLAGQILSRVGAFPIKRDSAIRLSGADASRNALRTGMASGRCFGLETVSLGCPLSAESFIPGWFRRGKTASERIGSRGFLPQSVRNRCNSIPALRIRREACMPKTDFLVPLPLFSGREEICPETLSSSVAWPSAPRRPAA